MKYFSLISLFFLMGCGVLQNGVSYFGEERVFEKYFENSPEIIRRDAEYGEPSWELGIAVKPHKDGRIKGIRIYNPTSGNIRLSIWDEETKTLLKSWTFNNGDGMKSTFNFCELPILAEKTYYVTINVRAYYYFYLPDHPFPIDNPDLTFLYSVFEETPYQTFPQNKVSNVFHGLIDLDVDYKIN